MALDAGVIANEHFLGLDMLGVQEPSGQEQCATLVEVWNTGVLVYTSEPIAAGTCVQVSAQGNVVSGVVDSCERDPYGQLVTISINPETGWFPDSYSPPYVMPAGSKKQNVRPAAGMAPLTPKPDVMSATSGR